MDQGSRNTRETITRVRIYRILKELGPGYR